MVGGDAKNSASHPALMIEHPALVESYSVGVVKVDMCNVRIHICCKLQILTEREKPVTILKPGAARCNPNQSPSCNLAQPDVTQTNHPLVTWRSQM